MKKILFFIAIIAMTTACATARLPQAQVKPISFSPEDVATGINEGIEMGEEVPPGFSSVWEEHSKLFPPKRNEPAWGWSLYDLDRDGLFEHIFYQYKMVKKGLKLNKLDIKTGEGKWQIGDANFIEEVENHLDDKDYDGARP